MILTRPQLIAIETFCMKELDGQYNQQQVAASKPFWERGQKGWAFARQTGTGQMRLLMWFQHTHQPGSQEWRPVIIIQAVLVHLKLPIPNGIYASREARPAAELLPVASQSVAGACQTFTGLPTPDAEKFLSAIQEKKKEFVLIRVYDEAAEEQDHREIQESLLIPFTPPPTGSHRRPGQPLLAAFTTCEWMPITSPF